MRPTSPKEILRQAKSSAFLVTDLINIRYLTGLSLSAGVVLVTPRRTILCVDSRYRFRADRDAAKGIVVRDMGDLGRFLADQKECGIEGEQVTVARFSNWKKKFPNTKFVQRVGVIQEFRRQKSDEELRALRRANRITHEILRRVPSALRSQTTEEKLAKQIQIWALELGADGMSFEPIVAFGTHTSSPHHSPTSRSLRKGHLVQVDIGAMYRGYCADASRVFFTVPPTRLQKSVYDTLLQAQEKAIRAAKAGASTQQLDRIAREVLRKKGYDHAFTHSLGHGVGLEIHEGVSLSSRAPDQKLLKNEVITVEPGVYFDGKFGMRVEDMVFVR